MKLRIEGFKDVIKEVLQKGLKEEQLEYDDEEETEYSDDEDGNPKGPTAERIEEKRLKKEMEEISADGKTFKWLIKELKLDG